MRCAALRGLAQLAADGAITDAGRFLACLMSQMSSTFPAVSAARSERLHFRGRRDSTYSTE